MNKQWMSVGATALLVGVLMVSAAVAASTPSLSGAWTFTFDSDRGGRNVAIEIAQEGDALTAKMEGATLTGALKGKAFDLSGDLYVAEAGRTSRIALNGQLNDDQLIGTGTWDTLALAFTAVRAK